MTPAHMMVEMIFTCIAIASGCLALQIMTSLSIFKYTAIALLGAIIATAILLVNTLAYINGCTGFTC